MLACRIEALFDVAIPSIVSDTSDEFPVSLAPSSHMPKSAWEEKDRDYGMEVIWNVSPSSRCMSN